MSQQQINSEKRLRAAVFGGSISGLMSALVLAKQGFEVVLYEKRKQYNRNIQWGIRQSFINYLACIDQSMAKDFNEVASGIRYGHRFLADKSFLYEHGAYHHQKRGLPKVGVCSDQDLSGVRTLDEEIVCLVPAKDLETFLHKKVALLDAVTICHKNAPPIEHDSQNDRYFLSEDVSRIPYDLIVVCEGASSNTRDNAGIDSMNLSKVITQVSGEVYLKRDGMITEYLHAINHAGRLREELLLSLLISTDRHKSSWIVGDVSSECLSALEKVLNEEDKRKAIIEDEFRKIAARTMLDTVENICDAGYRGAVRQVELFELQARISNKAVAGNNLVLAGDAVGVGHWAVGGGMHVAAVCHSKRLEALASSLRDNLGSIRADLQQYNNGVLADTIAWISRGIKYYYLSIPGDVLKDVFDKLIVELMKDNAIDFPRELKARVTSVYFG